MHLCTRMNGDSVSGGARVGVTLPVAVGSGVSVGDGEGVKVAATAGVGVCDGGRVAVGTTFPPSEQAASSIDRIIRAE